MTIFQLDIPHQKAPACWTATDREDYVVATIRANVASGWGVEEPTFDDAVAWNGRDMSGSHVFMDANEAARELVDGGRIGSHQWGKAVDALRAQVMRHSDEVTDPSLLDVLHVCWVDDSTCEQCGTRES